MARAQVLEVLRPSVLDRLIGAREPGSSRHSDSVGLRELRNAVARDLEWLLNSRAWVPYDIEEFEEARSSILTYGVPDFSMYSWRSSNDAVTIAGTLEDVIRRFEPRLLPGSVKVEILRSAKTTDIDDFRMCFRIDAVLHVEPITESVSFDTDVDFDGGSIHVKGVL